MEQPKERVLHSYGDRELWVAKADDASWSLPLYVEWRLDKEADIHFAHVFPAGICLYFKQALALNAMFEPHDIKGSKSDWVIPRRICEAILHKAPGVTPMHYYKWPEGDCQPIDGKPPLRTKMKNRGPTKQEKERGTDPLRRSFIEWLAKDSKISSSIINAVLTAVASRAPTWLIEHRKPVDLGFCRLVAVPFRANWKEIISFKAKCAGIKLRSLFNLPEDRRWTELEEAGLPDLMTSPHNVGLRPGWKGGAEAERIDYTIEAIASHEFESAANRIEGKRMARGPAAYIGEFEDAVEAVYKAAAHALAAYLKKVAAPYAEVVNGSGKGGIGFMPVLGRKVAVRGTPLCSLPVRVVDSGTRFSVFGRSGDEFLIQAPPSEVPQLPPIPPAAPDVRERNVNGDVELIGDSGANGLPLLPSTQGKAEGEPVLVKSEGSGTRLDDSGDGLITI